MTGNSAPLYTAAQVRELDRIAIEDLGIPGIDLMERAGMAVFTTAREAGPETQNWLVLCGGGNNGGDGYIVARLAIEAGLNVRLCALKPPESLKGDAAVAAGRWAGTGAKAESWPLTDLEQTDLVIDALLGTGLDRPPGGKYAEAIDAANQLAAVRVAVDIPSGLNADSGHAAGVVFKADRTVTFIGRKRGLYTAAGPDFCGRVFFDDLEVPPEVPDSITDSGFLIRENLVSENLRPRAANSHKGTYGWLLAVGGDRSMSGAVRLCGEAALRSGAGKVTLATSPEHSSLINLACPELMVRGVQEGRQLESLFDQVNVLVLGIGLGQTAWSEDLFISCVNTSLPIVLDADGLNILARLKSESGRLNPSRGNWVLTPHPSEAARLLGTDAGSVQADRVAVALELAERFNAVVVLKGCGTVVAEPSGRYAVCPLGNPGMATAGTGDVLAGVIGSLAAQGLDLWDAATTGVVAHAAAGDRAAADIGQRGMMASDITLRLPAVLNPD